MSALPRAYRYLLLLSLALNLGLGAALLVSHWHQGAGLGHSSERRWARIPDPRQFARALDEADRKVLLAVIETHRGQLSQHFRPLGQARRDVATALRAEPFDPAAMQRAFERVRGSETGNSHAMHAFMLDLATRISPSGRQRIADQLQRHARHRRDHPPAQTPKDPG